MAKQRTTGQGVVEALKGVSETAGNMGAVYGAAFTKGLQSGIDKSTARKKEREAENKAILKAAGAYLQGLDSNVDTVGLDFSDTDKAEVKRVSIEWRNEFADYANELARIEDKTSAEALELQDKMNGIKSRFNNLRANLEGVAKYKQEFSLNIDLDGNGEGRTLYSTAGTNKERLAQGKAILDQSFTINNEGGIVYPDQTISEKVIDEKMDISGTDVKTDQLPTKTITKVTSPGFTYQYNNFKKPFEQAVDTIDGAIAIYEQQASIEEPITDGEKDILTQRVGDLFKVPGALESFIADNDQLTEIFDFSDLSLDDGESRKEVQSEVVNRLVEAMAGARKPKSVNEENNESNPPIYGNKQNDFIRRLSNFANMPYAPGADSHVGSLGFGLNGDFVWNPDGKVFIMVKQNSDGGTTILKDRNGNIKNRSLAYVANQTGISEKDLTNALGLK